MNKIEALRFLITRLRVLNEGVQAMENNRTFASVGDWNAHMTNQAMRTQIPIWIKSLEQSLAAKEPEEA